MHAKLISITCIHEIVNKFSHIKNDKKLLFSIPFDSMHLEKSNDQWCVQEIVDVQKNY